MKKENLFKEAKNFFTIFEAKGEMLTGVKVPGSVTLLGDYAEFNRGKLLAANIDKQALLLAQKRRERDRFVYFYSKRYDEKIRVNLSEPQFREEHGWGNFMSMALFMLEGGGRKVTGMNVYIDNNIPDFFNCNNMEALQIGIVNIAEKFGDWKLSGTESAEICAEGDFQFMKRERNHAKYIPAIFGQAGAFTVYDAAKKEAQNAPIDLNAANISFMVMSSGVKKKSVERKAAAIKEEVATAISAMKNSGAQIDTLDALTLEKFDDYRGKLTLNQRKRCAYFISENERVDTAKKCLAKGNVQAFIDCINESQRNIKNRLEIVEGENESLLNVVNDTEGVKAARILNMGLDGTVLVITEKDKRPFAETKIKKSFVGITGLDLQTECFELNNAFEEINVNISEFGK